MNYEIPYVCISHTGRCRRMNQDNFICDGTYRELNEGADDPGQDPFVVSGSLYPERSAMLGVFDGMGGEECGEVAALLAAKEAAQSARDSEPAASLLSLCQRANSRICCYAGQNGVPAMGTTAALLSFDPESITLCNIGDSKILRFSDRGAQQLSVDHICAVPYGMKPPLSQNLGIPPTEMQIEPYTGKLDYRSGDVYLICSDGLTDMVSVDEITQVISGTIRIPADENTLEAAARQLLELALEGGGRDNITVILCGIVSRAA